MTMIPRKKRMKKRQRKQKRPKKGSHSFLKLWKGNEARKAHRECSTSIHTQPTLTTNRKSQGRQRLSRNNWRAKDPKILSTSWFCKKWTSTTVKRGWSFWRSMMTWIGKKWKRTTTHRRKKTQLRTTAGTTTQTKILTLHFAPNTKTSSTKTTKFSIATADARTGSCSPTTAFVLNKISTTVLPSEFGSISTKPPRRNRKMMIQKRTTGSKSRLGWNRAG